MTSPHTSWLVVVVCGRLMFACVKGLNCTIKNLFLPPAVKKVFSEDNEIQKVLDEDFIVLNLVVGHRPFQVQSFSVLYILISCQGFSYPGLKHIQCFSP